MLTINQVAERLSVDPQTVRAWIKAGKLAGVKLPGGDWRVKEEFLNNWLDKRTVKARAI